MAQNHADTAVTFEVGEPHPGQVRFASRLPDSLGQGERSVEALAAVEVQRRDVRIAHRGIVEFRVFGQQDRTPLDDRPSQ